MVSTSTYKRSRAMSSSCNPIACCLVDGCVSDLSKCREYHTRHKVCEVHSKTATVMVGGREQRFCQQRSRMSFFGETKDVREFILGTSHTRARVPTCSLPLMQPLSGNWALFTSHAETFSTTTVKSNWAPVIKVEDIPLNTHSSARHHHLPNEYVNYERFPLSSRGIVYKDNKKLPFVQENVLISDCVGSLLSSPKARNVAYGGDRNSIPQPLITSMKYDGILNCQMRDGNLGIVSISDCSYVDFSSHGLFHVEGEEFSDDDPQNLSFSWQ